MKIQSILISFVLLSSLAFSQVKFYKEGKSSLDIGFAYSSSSSIYDQKNQQRIYSKDTFNILINGTTEYKYALKRTFELRRYYLLLGYKYCLTNDLFISADVPLNFTSLTEKYEFDTNRYSPTYNRQTIISDMSLIQPDYYRISGYYRLMKSLYSPSFTVSGFIPPKFKNGYQNDTANNFKKYSAYQFYLGMINNLQFEKSFLELEAGYLLRTGNFQNQMMFRFEGGISTIANTSLYGIALYNQSFGGYENIRLANPVYSTLKESSIDLGAGFTALIDKKVFIDFNYMVRLGLSNTLNDSRFVIKSSLLLD